MNRRRRVFLGLGWLGLAALLVYCTLEYSQSAAALTAASDQLATCERLAGRLRSLRTTPTHAVSLRSSSSELTHRIEQAARAAEIPSEGLLRIDPGTSRRVGETSYVEQPTAVNLRAVTLGQLVAFLSDVTGGDSHLRSTAIRLTAPRASSEDDAPEQERWTGELTLTELVFSPQSAVPLP